MASQPEGSRSFISKHNFKLWSFWHKSKIMFLLFSFLSWLHLYLSFVPLWKSWQLMRPPSGVERPNRTNNMQGLHAITYTVLISSFQHDGCFISPSNISWGLLSDLCRIILAWILMPCAWVKWSIGILLMKYSHFLSLINTFWSCSLSRTRFSFFL